MDQILLNYGLPGVAIFALAVACRQLYSDNKSLQRKVTEISQSRIDDLKDINTARNERDIKMSQMVELIYNKLVVAKKGS